MAEYSEVFTSKLDWAMPFQRTGKFPLDRSSMFSSYEDALKYAQQTGDDTRKLGGTSYIGQIVVVYGKGIGVTNSDTGVTTYPDEVAAYIITAVGENAALQKLAQTTATGDFGADIAALQSSVSALDTRIKALEEEERVVDTNTTYTFATGDTTEGSIRVTDSNNNTYEVAIKGYDTLKALATGRTSAYVYANKFDTEYLTDIANPTKYKKGDIIYFTDTGIPDEWVTGKLGEQTAGSWYSFAQLETEHPDLTQYLKVADAQSTYATKTDLASKANTSDVTALSSTVSTLSGTVASNKTELEGKIQKVANDLAAVDVTAQITTEINKLDSEDFGNTNGNFYIKHIKQTDGVITAEAEAMPDFNTIAQNKADAAQQAAEANAATYTDNKVGALGEQETVVGYVDTKIGEVNGTISGVASRVQVLENQTLDTRLKAVEASTATNASNISDVSSRLTTTDAIARDAQTRVSAVETTVAGHTTQLGTLATDIAARVKTIQVGGINQTMTEDGTVNIATISTDVLVTGAKTLVLDCLNASLTDNS